MLRILLRSRYSEKLVLFPVRPLRFMHIRCRLYSSPAGYLTQKHVPQRAGGGEPVQNHADYRVLPNPQQSDNYTKNHGSEGHKTGQK